MSNRIVSRRIEIPQGSPLLLVARISNAQSGLPLTISQVSSFSVFIYDVTSGTPPVSVYSLGSISTSTGYFDTLQYDAENLLGDSGGYNFRYVIGYDDYAFAGEHLYRVEILSSIGNSYNAQIYDVNVVGLYSL